MRLVLDKFGVYVRKKGNRFEILFPKEKKGKEYSADKISQILFLKSAAISSEAIRLAMDKNIDILYLDLSGRPFARIYPCTLGGTTLTRKYQAEAYFSDKGTHIVKKIVEGKIKNQINFIKSLAKDKKDLKNNLNSFIENYNKALIDLNKINGPIDKIKNKLLGIEGFIAADYFNKLSLIIPIIRRDPKLKDECNIVLNYAYGVLYSEVERACILSGLDPYLGYYHSDRYGKPCLVLDLIEEFRTPIADRTVVTLFSRKEIKKEHFDESGGLHLSSKGRKKIIEAMLKRLHTKIKYNGKKWSFQNIILNQSRVLAQYLLGNRREYLPFIHNW